MMQTEQRDGGFVVLPGGVSPAESGPLSMHGVTLTFKAVAGDTGGQWSLMEYEAPGNFAGPAPHWHAKMTEAFYVLSGRLALRLNDEEEIAEAGTFCLVPPGVVHRFRNPDPAPTRFIVFCSPGGHEEFLREMLDLASRETSWPPKDQTKIIELWQRHDTFPPAK